MVSKLRIIWKQTVHGSAWGFVGLGNGDPLRTFTAGDYGGLGGLGGGPLVTASIGCDDPLETDCLTG